jgi:hypothetical protein
MATTVPIVTDVTKDELDALVAANGLNEGLQYKVTDKGWVLIANSNNTLKSLDDILIINNGDTIPEYIIFTTLIVDTGEITADITIPGIEIVVDRSKYIPKLAIINVIYNDDLLHVTDLCDGTFDIIDGREETAIDFSMGINYKRPTTSPRAVTIGSNHRFKATTNGGALAGICRLILEYEKVPSFI